MADLGKKNLGSNEIWRFCSRFGFIRGNFQDEKEEQVNSVYANFMKVPLSQRKVVLQMLTMAAMWRCGDRAPVVN